MIPRRFWAFLDLLVMACAFGLAYALIPWWHLLFDKVGLLGFGSSQWFQEPSVVPALWPKLEELSLIYLAVGPVGAFTLDALGAYRPIMAQRYRNIVFSGMVAPLPGLGLMLLVLFGLHTAYGHRLFIFSFVGLSGLFLAAYRLVWRRHWLSRVTTGQDLQNTLLVGSLSDLNQIMGILQSSRWGFRICGYLDVDRNNRLDSVASAGSSPAGPVEVGSDAPLLSERPSGNAGVPCLGSVDKLANLLISQHTDEVVAVVSGDHAGPDGWLNGVISACDQLGVSLRVVPFELAFRKEASLRLLKPDRDFPLACLTFVPAYVHAEGLFAKRVLDFVLAGVLLVLISPLLALIALVIKLAEPKQPVIYLWKVIGQNGQPFTSYKFRTMIPNADALKAQLVARNEMKGPVFKITDDPRVTPVGRILRKFSLDELPQLWSVVKGDMSLVGPRPAGPHELKRYEFWHKRKLSIKPGITCLWQVNGRNDVNDFDDWVRMDLEYIDNWSFWLDLKILVWTAWAVVAGTGK